MMTVDESAKQVKEMNEAAAMSNKVFGIMYNQRTRPAYQKLKNLVKSESTQPGYLAVDMWYAQPCPCFLLF